MNKHKIRIYDTRPGINNNTQPFIFYLNLADPSVYVYRAGSHIILQFKTTERINITQAVDQNQHFQIEGGIVKIMDS